MSEGSQSPLERLVAWQPDQRKAEERFIENANANRLRLLADIDGDYPDTKIAVNTAVEATPRIMTVGELRAVLSDSRFPYIDPDPGFEVDSLYILGKGKEADRLLGDLDAEAERIKQRGLAELKAYPDEQVLWTLYPNRPSPTQTTAKELRVYYNGLKRDDLEAFRDWGGIQIISTDSDFDPVAYMKVNQEAHHATLKAAVKKASRKSTDNDPN